MGCASSTPMIQTTGSEMLKAATHVATDATKTTEDAVEGIKDSIGKTLETAKDSVATTIDNVKHEVENVVKDKAEMVEDAKNTLMEKLHLKQNENEKENENEKDDDKTKTEEVQTQLNEQLKHSNSHSSLAETMAMTALKENVLARSDSERDSLKTSTPEPEIERALSRKHDNQEDDEDNPPTPKPTLGEFETLTAELLQKQQQQQQQQSQQLEGITMVNNLKMNNETLMSVMHENIQKHIDDNDMTLSTNVSKTIKDNEPLTAVAAATAAASALAIHDSKSNIVHQFPQSITTAARAKPLQIQPLKLATTATATPATAKVNQFKQGNDIKKLQTISITQQVAPTTEPSKLQTIGGNLKKADKVSKQSDEKRPGTTEWEKFADMLAQMRKYNPHDAFRRGGTLTKLGPAAGGIGQLRERAVAGHHARSGVDDDSSDSTSYIRGSPLSSHPAIGGVHHLQNRPNTGHNATSSTHIADGSYAFNQRSNSNISATNGRKFDFNPTRSRVNEFVSSTSLNQSILQTSESTQMHFAPDCLESESVKSPTYMRSQHSGHETITLPPLDVQMAAKLQFDRESTAYHHNTNHHRHHQQQNYGLDLPHNKMSLQNETPLLTRQSSNTSLFSTSSSEHNLPTLNSSNPSMKLQPTKNTSSFLATPRCSAFGLTKSYTDLYFSTTANKENKVKNNSKLRSKCKSPFQESKSYTHKNT